MREVPGMPVREPPLFTTEAQIFLLDAKAQRTWVETSTRSVPVHLYHDLNRRSFRIISVEGSKPVLNGKITSAVIVKKASSKFLQWMDSKANVVYGLGFSSEDELERFMEKVQKIQELAAQTYTGGDGPVHSIDNFFDDDENNTMSEDSAGSDQLIRLENERLKAALAQSSANARKWEEELAGLKDVNQRLNDALKARCPKLVENSVCDGNLDEKSVGPVLSHLAETLSSCLPEQTMPGSAEEPQEILQQVEQVIRLNHYLQERINCMEKESKEWKESVTTFHEQIGVKLKELLHLYGKLANHLQQSTA